jgi:hypothetical protein
MQRYAVSPHWYRRHFHRFRACLRNQHTCDPTPHYANLPKRRRADEGIRCICRHSTPNDGVGDGIGVAFEEGLEQYRQKYRQITCWRSGARKNAKLRSLQINELVHQPIDGDSPRSASSLPLNCFRRTQFPENTACRAYGPRFYRQVYLQNALPGDDGTQYMPKDLLRIWKLVGRKVPQKQPRRNRLQLANGSCIRLRPMYRNHVWSWDFVMDRTDDGRAIKMVTLTKEFTEE